MAYYIILYGILYGVLFRATVSKSTDLFFGQKWSSQ